MISKFARCDLPVFISDHCFLECNLTLPKPNFEVKEIKFRRTKQINVSTFKADIAASNLCRITTSSLDDIAKCYDDTLSHILDKHAPLQKKVVVFRPRVPWYNNELKDLKAKRRKLEKKMLKSRSLGDAAVYRNVCNAYSVLLNNARTSFYTDCINDCNSNSKTTLSYC